MQIWFDTKRSLPECYVLVRNLEDAKSLIESRDALAAATNFGLYRVNTINVDVDNKESFDLIQWIVNTNRHRSIILHGCNPDNKKTLLSICHQNGLDVKSHSSSMRLYETDGVSCRKKLTIAKTVKNGFKLVYAECEAKAKRLCERYSEEGEKSLMGTIWQANRDVPNRNVICETRYHVNLNET